MDRNTSSRKYFPSRLPSLSARRAWIEMLKKYPNCRAALVALRKESVDRNKESAVNTELNAVSLSARRAWIEITVRLWVAPQNLGRSPQGERG